MGRTKSKLLPEKLEVIREHVGISKKDLASKLEVTRKLKVTSRRVSDYERGRCEPTLMETHLYARLAGVTMNLIADDMVSVDSFRRLLRKQKRTSSNKAR